MKAYLINTDTMKFLGKFNSIADADTEAAKHSYGFTVVTDEADIVALLRGPDILKLYNQLVDKPLVKFSTKADGAARLMMMLKVQEEKSVTEETATPKTKPKKEPAQDGYKGHRAGSTKGELHQWLDENTDATRPEFVEQATSRGISVSTARGWFSAFRRSA